MSGAAQITIDKAAQAVAMHDMGYPHRAINDVVGVSASSVSDILNRRGRWGDVLDSPVFVELRTSQNRALELAARTMAAQLWIEAMKPEKLEKASTYQLVGSGSWLLEKAQLLAGLPTENIAVSVQATISIDDLSSRLAQRLVDK